jgi:hypothetical protein
MDHFSESVAKSVGRHFVTLSCVQYPHDEEDIKIHVCSGFMMEVKGEWFYMTAGHILRDVRLALDAGSKFDIWRFGDQTAGNRFHDTAVPYDFDLDQWFVLHEPEVGLDYATVHIGGLLRRLLEAGGVVALGRNAWGDHATEHEHWALVGIPRETVAYDGKTVISAKFVMAPLHPTETPTLAEQKAANQFYAQLADNSEGVLRDVDGMSGGPVFSLHQVEDIWKYRVIGVQSAWYRSSRVVAVCPFTSFAEALEPIVEEALVLASSSGSSGSSA